MFEDMQEGRQRFATAREFAELTGILPAAAPRSSMAAFLNAIRCAFISEMLRIRPLGRGMHAEGAASIVAA